MRWRFAVGLKHGKKCVCCILGLKLLWHTLDRSTVLLRIEFDGEELRKNISARRVNSGVLCLIVASNVIKFSQRLCCNDLLRSKFLVILLLSLWLVVIWAFLTSTSADLLLTSGHIYVRSCFNGDFLLPNYAIKCKYYFFVLANAEF